MNREDNINYLTAEKPPVINIEEPKDVTDPNWLGFKIWAFKDFLKGILNRHPVLKEKPLPILISNNSMPKPFTIFHPADGSINSECREDILFKEVYSGCSYDSYHDVLEQSQRRPTEIYLKTGLRPTTIGDVFLYDNKYFQVGDCIFTNPSAINIQHHRRAFSLNL